MCRSAIQILVFISIGFYSLGYIPLAESLALEVTNIHRVVTPSEPRAGSSARTTRGAADAFLLSFPSLDVTSGERLGGYAVPHGREVSRHTLPVPRWRE